MPQSVSLKPSRRLIVNQFQQVAEHDVDVNDVQSPALAERRAKAWPLVAGAADVVGPKPVGASGVSGGSWAIMIGGAGDSVPMEPVGIEPTTSALQRRRSPS